MVHGGIDGFSRLIVFLQSSSNNKSSMHFEVEFSSMGCHNEFGVIEAVKMLR